MKITKILVLLFGMIAAGFSLSTTRVSGNEQKESGKDLYRADCRICHDKESPNGEYSPMSFTQDQWKKFFDTKLATTHKDIVLAAKSAKLLEVLTSEQLAKIKKYCVDHAADSEQPQTCSE